MSMPGLALLAVLFLAPQQAEEVPRLVERLGSDSVEERNSAEARLKELGKAAVPAIEKAAAGGDRERAERARRILALISFRESLTPALRKARPGVEARLAAGAAHACTRELLGILDGFLHPPAGLEWKDLVPLFPLALAGAETAAEKVALLEAAERARAPQTASSTARLLEDAASEVIEQEDLLSVARAGTSWILIPLLGSWRPDGARRREHARVLRAMNPDLAIPEILARDRCGEFEQDECAVRALLSDLDRATVRSGILAALEAEGTATRRAAAHLAAELGLKETAALLRKLLQDSEARVRSEAPTALARLGLREETPAIEALLKDDDEHARFGG
jgi:hypothetical protein